MQCWKISKHTSIGLREDYNKHLAELEYAIKKANTFQETNEVA